MRGPRASLPLLGPRNQSPIWQSPIWHQFGSRGAGRTNIEEHRVHNGNRDKTTPHYAGYNQKASHAHSARRTPRSLADVADAAGRVGDRDLPPAVVDLAVLPTDAFDSDWSGRLLRAADAGQLPASAWLEQLLVEPVDHF